jgi:hypothetical protein
MTARAAPRERIYSGSRIDGSTVVRRTDADGTPRHLPPRFDLAKHSPTGFEWGYEGSGPAQLSLALLCDALGDVPLACRVYQEFKRAVVGRLGDSWILVAGDIADKAKALDAANAERRAAVHG